MPSSELPHSPIGKDRSEDRATAAILAAGGADGVSAFAVRYWSSHGSQTMPVFITWLLGIGRFCLTVKYGRYSLRGEDCHIDTGQRLRGTQSPLDQAQLEAMRVGQALPPRLNRSAPSLRPWPSTTWSATGASNASPAGAASPCSGTWSAAPPCWPRRRPTPTFVNRWPSRWPWMRYPHCSSAPPTSAWVHLSPEGTAPHLHRVPDRHNPSLTSARPDPLTGFPDAGSGHGTTAPPSPHHSSF